MEIRCGNCNKLFRVSNDKIIGKGIKFACTRCGEYVKITREDFEHYTLSQNAVTALDMFEAKPEKRPQQEPAEVEQPGAFPLSAKSADVPDTVFSRASTSMKAVSNGKKGETDPQGAHDFLKERDGVYRPDLNRDEERVSIPVPQIKNKGEFEIPGTAPSESSLAVVSDSPSTGGPEQPDSLTDLRVPSSREDDASGKAKSDSAYQMMPHVMPSETSQNAVRAEQQSKPKSAAKPKPLNRQADEPVRGTIPAAAAASPSKKQTARTSDPSQLSVDDAINTTAQTTVRSNRAVIIIAVIMIGLIGTGTFFYLRKRSSAPQTNVVKPSVISAEGLLISNAAGSLESNGDLVISGIIENTSEVEKNKWYAVVDVYDATGSVLREIQLLNGRQIYTHGDYEILAQRGENVKELKEDVLTLMERKYILAPKSKAPFEVRCLQPPVGIASFNATLQQADISQLLREIARETE